MSLILLLAIAFGVVLVLAAAFAGGQSDARKRVRNLVEDAKPTATRKFSLRAMLFGPEDNKDNRRRQVQESLQQIEQRARSKAKRRSLAELADLADAGFSVRNLQYICGGVGLALALAAYLIGLGVILPLGLLGLAPIILPRWFLLSAIKRRERKFLDGLPDAIDVMVRALRSGLPVTDAMKVIATESSAPIGPEFRELVEAQRIGISIDQGLERMYERINLPEINFLQIVITIQMKTGGNLSEALGNLSKVLRERRRMKGKIASASQEAKSSAAIIGSLPIVIVGALTFLSPDYLDPLFETGMGNLIAGGALLWMALGVFVMHKMTQLDI